MHKKDVEKIISTMDTYIKTTQDTLDNYAEAVALLAKSIAALAKEIENQKSTINILSANSNYFLQEIKYLYQILNTIKIDENSVITLQ